MTAMEAVLDGLYDAAVTTENRFLQVSAREKLVLLKRFDDDGYLIAGKASLGAEAASSFRRAMTELKDPALLESFWPNPIRFQACSDSDFVAVRQKLILESLFDEDASTEQTSASRAGNGSR